MKKTATILLIMFALNTIMCSCKKDIAPSVLDDLCVIDGYIYFVHAENNLPLLDGKEHLPLIYRIPVSGGQSEAVWSIDMFPGKFMYGIGNMLIADLQVIGELLCFMDSGISMIAYYPKTDKTFRLLEEFISFAALDETLYYVDRTFSLYCKPLYKPDAEPELLIGKGSAWPRGEEYPDEIMIDSVYTKDGKLFFAGIQGNKEKTWEYKKNGNYKQISEK